MPGPPETPTMRHGYLVLAVVSMSSFQMAMALSVMFVVFPDLQRDFPGASASSLSWVINVFTIVSAATLVVASTASERWGRKRTVLAGTALFTGASVAAALAPNVGALVVIRGVQALATAVTIPAAVTIVMNEFPPHRRGTAVAMWGAVGSMAAASGPALGGLLVEAGGWRWTFWFNVPIGIAAIVAGAVVLRESRASTRAPIPDLAGAGILLVAIGAFVFGVLQSDSWGWGDARTLAAIALGPLLLAGLASRSRRHPRPVFPPTLFRIRSFVTANAAVALMALAFFGFQFASILFLIDTWGYSIRSAGLLGTPVFVANGLASGLAGPIGDRLGYSRVLLVGGLFWATGALLVREVLGTSPDVLAWLVLVTVMGLGSGLLWAGMFAVSVADLPTERLALGASSVQTTQRIGNATGIALTVTIFGAQAVGGGASAFKSVCLLAAVTVLVAAAATASSARRPRLGGPAPLTPDLLHQPTHTRP